MANPIVVTLHGSPHVRKSEKELTRLYKCGSLEDVPGAEFIGSQHMTDTHDAWIKVYR